MKLHTGPQRLDVSPCFRQTAPRARFVAKATAATSGDLGFKMMRKGVKEAASETILSPRFYTTDFEAMEDMFS